jgi:hypothetical protein
MLELDIYRAVRQPGPAPRRIGGQSGRRDFAKQNVLPKPTEASCQGALYHSLIAGIVRAQHGVWLIDLAPLGEPRLVAGAVAGVLGL